MKKITFSLSEWKSFNNYANEMEYLKLCKNDKLLCEIVLNDEHWNTHSRYMNDRFAFALRANMDIMFPENFAGLLKKFILTAMSGYCMASPFLDMLLKLRGIDWLNECQKNHPQIVRGVPHHMEYFLIPKEKLEFFCQQFRVAPNELVGFAKLLGQYWIAYEFDHTGLDKAERERLAPHIKRHEELISHWGSSMTTNSRIGELANLISPYLSSEDVQEFKDRYEWVRDLKYEVRMKS